MSTLQELFIEGKSRLKNSSHSSLEAKLLLLKCTLITEEEFYANPERKVSQTQKKAFFKLAAKRIAGCPLAYLTGEKEFWSLTFKVFPGVLIPRPETELIVEKAIEFSTRKKETILDVGTGCGNIAVSLAKELPRAQIFASDISVKALKAAQLNASLHGTSRITFIQGHLFSPFMEFDLQEKCDFIVSNPPYVVAKEWETLQLEIKNHEPKRALVSGKSGLEVIKKLIEGASRYLKSKGILVFEIGGGQKEEVQALFGKEWRKVQCFKDLNGIPRVFTAQKTARPMLYG